MKIKFCEQNVGWESFSDYKESHEFGFISVENKINQILSNLEEMDYLINNRSKMSTNDFINTLTKVCLFQLSDLDMCRILSSIYDKQYIDSIEINTTMYCDYGDSGRTKINYYIAYTKDSDINGHNNCKYHDVKAITELVNKKEIIILDKIEEELWTDSDVCERIEKYSSIPQFPVKVKNYNNDSYGYYQLSLYLLSRNDIYKEYLYKYVRNRVKKYMLEREMKNTLCLFNNDINDIYSRSSDLSFGITPSVEFTRECTDIINEKGYSKRLEKLMDKYC